MMETVYRGEYPKVLDTPASSLTPRISTQQAPQRITSLHTATAFLAYSNKVTSPFRRQTPNHNSRSRLTIVCWSPRV